MPFDFPCLFHVGLSEQMHMWEQSQRSAWWSLSLARSPTPTPAKTFSPGRLQEKSCSLRKLIAVKAEIKMKSINVTADRSF